MSWRTGEQVWAKVNRADWLVGETVKQSIKHAVHLHENGGECIDMKNWLNECKETAISDSIQTQQSGSTMQ